MVNTDYIECLWTEQSYKYAQSSFFGPQAGNNTHLDFQDLFWLYAAIIERAGLCHSNKFSFSIHEFAKQVGLSLENTRQGTCYLKENGDDESLRLYLKNPFYCSPKKPKVKALKFCEE